MDLIFPGEKHDAWLPGPRSLSLASLPRVMFGAFLIVGSILKQAVE
jgi:hypothetical protein